MRIAWFSSISFTELLRASEFTKEILRVMPDDVDVELFVSDADLNEIDSKPDEFELSRDKIFHFLRAYKRHNFKKFDLFVFQLEDHPRAGFVQLSLEVWPGVVYFHDLNLGRLDRSRIGYSAGGALLNDAMDEMFGTDSVRLGDWQARGWSIDVLDGLYAHGERELRKSPVIAVQNVRAVQEIRAKNIDSTVELAPFPVTVESGSMLKSAREKIRSRLGLDDETFVVGYFGVYPLEDRAHKILSCFSEFKRNIEAGNYPGFRRTRLIWLLQNSAAKESYSRIVDHYSGTELEATLNDVLTIDASLVTGLRTHLAALDLALALRFDALRAISPMTLWCLADNVPVVVSNFGPSSELPNEICFQIDVGENEAMQLTKVFDLLGGNPSVLEEIKRRARHYIESVHLPELILLDFQELAKRSASRLRELNAESGQSVEHARDDIVSRIEKVYQTSAISPDEELGKEIRAVIAETLPWNEIR